MKIYMVRHGQSEANLKSMLSTWDVPLTESGINDAKMAGRLLSGLKFDKVLYSPYLRAKQTFENAMPNVEGEELDCIHEFYCGSLEGHTYKDMFEKYGDKLQKEIDVDNFGDYGGENYADVRARARQFMAYCEGLNAEKVVAFSHAGFILTLFDEIMGRPGKPGRNIDCHNGSVSVFKYNNGKWTIDAFNITENSLK